MFTKSAAFYDAMYSFRDYRTMAETLRHMILERSPAAVTLLDVGCGSGAHLQHLAPSFEVAGLDVEPGMVEMARTRCPQAEFSVASMDDFSLDRRFDVVTCLFSAIGYVRTKERMIQSIARMAAHLNPGGLLLVEPWFSRERYWTGTITSNHGEQGTDLKVSWMYTSELENDLAVLDIHYLVGQPGSIEHLRERHELGLFSVEDQCQAFRDAGLEDVEHLESEPWGRGMYIGRAGASPAR